jgi:hypothetical protein
MKQNYSDILQQNNINLNYTPDFVIIELPALIYNSTQQLMSNSDLGFYCVVLIVFGQMPMRQFQTYWSNLPLKFIINGCY